MKQPLSRFLFWTPRILGLLFAAFLSVFALDVFGHGAGFWKTLLALLVHLIPTWILLITVAISWRRPWFGALVFTALGVLYPVLFWGRFAWQVYLFMSGPLLLVGGLFLLNWHCSRNSRLNPITEMPPPAH